MAPRRNCTSQQKHSCYSNVRLPVSRRQQTERNVARSKTAVKKRLHKTGGFVASPSTLTLLPSDRYSDRLRCLTRTRFRCYRHPRPCRPSTRGQQRRTPLRPRWQFPVVIKFRKFKHALERGSVTWSRTQLRGSKHGHLGTIILSLARLVMCGN